VTEAKKIKIALIQQKNSKNRDENLRKGLVILEKAARSGANIVVFPELSFLPFLPQNPSEPGFEKLAETVPGPTCNLLAEKAREYGLVIVFNLPEKEGGKTYDASPVIDSDGKLIGVNRMVHVMEAPRFHEKGYDHPGDLGAGVFDTAAG